MQRPRPPVGPALLLALALFCCATCRNDTSRPTAGAQTFQLRLLTADGRLLSMELPAQTTVEELESRTKPAVEMLKKGAMIRLNDGRPALLTDLRTLEGTDGRSAKRVSPRPEEKTQQQETASGLPPIDRIHIFCGAINVQGRAVGFHYRGEQLHRGKARVTEVLDEPNDSGVYRARVEIYDSQRGTWIPKKALSSFFPDAWSSDRVVLEIYSAFINRTITRHLYWEGVSSSGIKIAGYLDFKDHIRTAFPFYR